MILAQNVGGSGIATSRANGGIARKTHGNRRNARTRWLNDAQAWSGTLLHQLAHIPDEAFVFFDAVVFYFFLHGPLAPDPQSLPVRYNGCPGRAQAGKGKRLWAGRVGPLQDNIERRALTGARPQRLSRLKGRSDDQLLRACRPANDSKQHTLLHLRWGLARHCGTLNVLQPVRLLWRLPL